RGIGRAVAVSMAEAGAAVVVSDVDEAAARETAEAIQSEGHKALGLRCDVTSESDVAGLADRAEAELGPIAVWVNNAGIIRPAMLHKMELDNFQAVLAVHVHGTFLGMRE